MWIPRVLVWACVAHSMGVAHAVSLTLSEVDRFQTRLPFSLDYSVATCTLWVSGNSHVINRVTLEGKRVETRSGSYGINFTAIRQGKLLAVERTGRVMQLSQDRSSYWGSIDAGNQSRQGQAHIFGELITGGDIRSDGAFIVSSNGRSDLRLFLRRNNPRSVAQMGVSGSYRGVAYEPTFERTFALFRSGASDRLIVFDRDFQMIATQNLSSWGNQAEGLAIQPETGDVFISFMQSTLNGEIVRFRVDGLSSQSETRQRPVFKCATS